MNTMSADEENPVQSVCSAEKSSCLVEATLKVISGRWKVLILQELCCGVKRFGELKRALHPITEKMLAQQLREMEKDGIVHRQIYLQAPPRVDYSLTPLGKSLQPILQAMHDWGAMYTQRCNSANSN